MKGTRIKLLREEKNLTQSELAKILSISSSAIAMYERDVREPNDELTLKIAEFFDVSTDYLLGASNLKKFENANKLNLDGLNDEDLSVVQTLIDHLKSIKK